LEQPQLLHLDRGARAQQHHLGRTAGHLRLPHVDERRTAHLVARLRELLELLVVLQLLQGTSALSRA